MAEFEKKMELNSNSKPNNNNNNNLFGSSFFNRSLTIQTPKSAPKDCVQPPSRFYNSFESMKGKVKKLCNIFETARTPKDIISDALITQANNKLKSIKSMGTAEYRFGYGFNASGIRLPGTEDKIVVYFTSLRGIRRTYEDCYAVRMIFRGFRACVDERDISMDSAYKKELQSVLGERNVTLPQVFIRGNHVGGAEVIKSMFETGELAKVLDGFPRREPGFVCERCGDVRFVPCGNCNGSRKLFDVDEGVLKRCLECNENGLIRCSDCHT